MKVKTNYVRTIETQSEREQTRSESKTQTDRWMEKERVLKHILLRMQPNTHQTERNKEAKRTTTRQI